MLRKRIFAIILTLCLITGCVRFLPEEWISSPASASDSFNYEEDTWCFSSDLFCDGSTTYINTQLKQALLKNKNDDEKTRLSEMSAAECTDLSYGMSVLALLHYAGIWNSSEIDNTAGTLRSIPAPIRKNVFYSWLNYYNLLQYTDDIVSLDQLTLSSGDSIFTAIDYAETETPAVMRLYPSAESTSPATVLIYGSESGSWTFGSEKFENRILIADPVNTEFSEDYCLIKIKVHGIFLQEIWVQIPAQQ